MRVLADCSSLIATRKFPSEIQLSSPEINWSFAAIQLRLGLQKFLEYLR